MSRLSSKRKAALWAVAALWCTTHTAVCTANPVVFVHGYDHLGSASAGDVWNNMARLMREDAGWGASELYQVNLYGGGRTTATPIEELAEYLAQEIDVFYANNGNVPIDIVAHSMGGLVVRAMVANGNLSDGVLRRFVPIATPHYGQDLAPSVQASQMKYGSRFLWEMAAAWEFDGKSLPRSDVLSIVGLLNNDLVGWDGLVHYWSAALADTAARYVDRGHSGAHARTITACRGADDVLGTSDDSADAVYLLVTSFLTNGTVPAQNDPGFVAGGGLAAPNAPNGVVFFQSVDGRGDPIPYDKPIVASAVPNQGLGVFLSRSHGDLANAFGYGDANLIGVELLGSSRADRGLLPATYELAVSPSQGATHPLFNRSGITVTAGRTTVVCFRPSLEPLDFDGDGQNDVASYQMGAGAWSILQSSVAPPNDNIAQKWGVPGDLPVPGDYDGDGQTDIAVFRMSTGMWHIILSKTQEYARGKWGIPADVPVCGDYDGDRLSDLAIFRRDTSTWYLHHSSDGASTVQKWGVSGDIPVSADYDGDGRTDIGIYRYSTKQWIIQLSGDGAVLRRKWGIDSDIPVPADYDGDRLADIAVFRPTTGYWYVLLTASSTPVIQKWGIPGDTPVPADYDGDKISDFAIRRPSDGKWVIERSSDGTATIHLREAGDWQPVLPQYHVNRLFGFER